MKAKLYKYTVPILLAISIILTLSCCSKSAFENDQEHMYFAKGGDPYFFDDKLYTLVDTSVYFYDLSDRQGDILAPLPLCSDPLCTHGSECPLYIDIPHCMVIDKYETKKNNGKPIIYMTTGRKIIRYDAAKNSSETVTDNITGIIEEMWIYNDKIYYIHNSFSDEPYSMNCITKDGRDAYVLEHESRKYKICIAGFWNEKIYFYDDTMQYYYADIDLKSERLLMETKCFPSAVVYDGYIYFCDDVKEQQVSDTFFDSCTMYKLSLENPESDKEEIASGILTAPCPFIFPSGNKILYNISDPRKTGGYEFLDYDGNTQKVEVFSTGSNKVYSYDMDMGETSVLVENLGVNLAAFFGADDRHLVIGYTEYDWDKTVNERPPSGNMAYDYIDNKKILLK